MVLVHGQLAPLFLGGGKVVHHGGKARKSRYTHVLVARKRERDTGRAMARYSPQGHTPSDLFPLVRK
jgi:hypothetical protein